MGDKSLSSNLKIDKALFRQVVKGSLNQGSNSQRKHLSHPYIEEGRKQAVMFKTTHCGFTKDQSPNVTFDTKDTSVTLP